MILNEIHTDKRGSIYSITEGLLFVPEIVLFKTNVGYARGGCIHLFDDECICVFEGKIEYFYKDYAGNNNCKVLCNGDSFKIGPNIPHYFISLTDSIVVEWGPSKEDKQTRFSEYRKIVDECNERRNNNDY